MGKDEIPDTHPRSLSLKTRHALIDGVENNIVTPSGLIAHGRGEAFDYLLGEETHPFALEAIKASAAAFKLSKHSVISVNGNTAILCPQEMVEFSNKTKIPLEINLFYRSEVRIEAIKNQLLKYGAKYILGILPDQQIELDGFDSLRRFVDKEGIEKADLVFVPLEDGDRTENLVKMGKKVITIDLNPLSRTSIQAHITIVDNIQRYWKHLEKFYFSMSKEEAKNILDKYNNNKILNESLEIISTFWQKYLKRKQSL
jgi:4-phosphopantoate---beta-alanine ligase